MPAPSINTDPVLSGTQEVGYTLTCSTGSWTGGVDSYAYQWQGQLPGEHPFQNITGATANSYTILSGDHQHIIRCLVTATNSSGSGTAYSDSTVAIPNDLLIVEDGSALSTANTYVDIEYADAYFAIRNIAAWFDYDVGDRKALLIRAACYIDGLDFIGVKSTQTQAMQWPRYDVTVDRYSIDSDVIPKNVKDAQCEAALRFGLEAIQQDLDSGFVTSEKVDVIEITYSDYSNDGKKKFPIIDSLLRKYVVSYGNFHRVVRS